MNQARNRAPTPLPLVRRFEHSRLEVDFLTAAYALAFPVLRRPLSPPRPAAKGQPTRPRRPRAHQGGGLRA